MSHVEEARRVLQIEAQSLLKMAESLDERFSAAVEMIVACKGKVILTGMGKSGHVARKISSTFSSTGTSSLYVHPAETAHGDLGAIAKGDLVIAASFGGDSPELAPLLQYVARKGIPLIALTGRRESTLARAAQIVLEIVITEEACPMRLAPTSSSTTTLALGDALATAALKQRGFRKEDFAEFHPGGVLGKRLTTRVADVMHSGAALPLVRAEEPIAKVISTMTTREVRGVAGVVDEDGSLIGVITDGDIRRRLEKSLAPLTELARDLMSKAPKTIDCEELAEKAAFLMQQFQFQILFAVDRTKSNPRQPVGILHIQDLLKADVL
jgi:arabinose-5-phosphate isomerase